MPYFLRGDCIINFLTVFIHKKSFYNNILTFSNVSLFLGTRDIKSCWWMLTQIALI